MRLLNELRCALALALIFSVVWPALSWFAFRRQPPRVSPPTNVDGDSSGKTTAILIVTDLAGQRIYARTIASMRAYADHQRYALVVWDPWSDHPINRIECQGFKHLFFRRHCVARFLLLREYTTLAAVDADVAVVDFQRRIEDLFRTPRQSVVHEERFHNGEVHAGAYVVRRGAFADAYLQRWSEMETRLPYAGFNNGDNGALHLHLLNTLYGANSPQAARCGALWDVSSNLDTYDAYVGCAMSYLFNATTAPDIRLVRRGHGFCRDLWVTESQTTAGVDMWVHGIKERDPMPGVSASIDAMRPVMALADAKARRERPKSLLAPARIDHCWPLCPEYWDARAIT